MPDQPTDEAEGIDVLDRPCEIRMEYSPHRLEQIRRIVGARLRCWGLHKLVYDTSFVATELCSNVRHCADSTFEFVIRRTLDGVRLEVADTSHELVPIPTEPPDLFQPGGRGLFLVAAQASAVGMTPTATGKVVWAEIALGDVDAESAG
ncbi:ATP-binding protein [Streptomyces sp. VRA16 Mangrove soil]|uniref:ATP-binding protein n=1 Tax=Streptomyces sp. VRA16 Mangrove soil TaxID=2817434 RepID=UPI001A9D9DFD|nr:ATP-binding protein [Streptomyces sp. VRA16 Mangrove soil]MBO1335871.1 ATP-binding protein [Streptomyces sp. VRA16 Mangrove soil]